MTAQFTTTPTDAMKIAAASLPGCGMPQGNLRGNDSALAERCAR